MRMVRQEHIGHCNIRLRIRMLPDTLLNYILGHVVGLMIGLFMLTFLVTSTHFHITNIMWLASIVNQNLHDIQRSDKTHKIFVLGSSRKVINVLHKG